MFTGQFRELLACGRESNGLPNFAFQLRTEEPFQLGELAADQAVARFVVRRNPGDTAGLIHIDQSAQPFQ